jgi:DNA replication and repair protein RecF
MAFWLSGLRLRDFRCFSEIWIDPGPGTNFFLGPNAAGKTSLLEAVCVLLRLQSPRTTSLARCTRFAQPGFGVEGEIRTAGEQAAGCLKLGIRQDAGGRKLRIDDVLQPKSSEYLRVSRVTWFGNEDLELIRGGGSTRRRYFDFLGAQLVPGYLPALRSYERALRARNFLLREGRPRREIDAQSDPLADAGTCLSTARRALFPRLQPLFREAVAVISGGKEEVELAEQPGHEGGLRAALDASRGQEERLRQTVVGPHRDDWEVSLDGQAAADFASEGQQRTLALAFKLAQSHLLEAETGSPPILLLDDIFGELDPSRRERLLASLPEKSQKFITTTFLDWCAPPADARQFSLVGRANKK